MPIRLVTLEESTPAQRREYARSFLNLPVEDADTNNEISAKIAAAQPGNTNIFVQDADTPADVVATETAQVALSPEEVTGKITGTLGKGDPRAVIHIPAIETEDGSGTRDVFVGVNGRAWQLMRGVDLPVPWRVVEALQNAEADIVRHRSDEGHEGEVQVKKAKRMAFHFVEKPSAAEIDAWLVRTGAEFCA